MPEMKKALRAQHHEFINHMQVVHAMLQMGRVEKAMKYIEEMAKDPSLVAPQPNCFRETGLVEEK
jgi:pentatricopeptide repeat protein